MKLLAEEARVVLRTLERGPRDGSWTPALGELMRLTGLSAEELGAAFCEIIRCGILDYHPGDGYRVVDPV